MIHIFLIFSVRLLLPEPVLEGSVCAGDLLREAVGVQQVPVHMEMVQDRQRLLLYSLQIPPLSGAVIYWSLRHVQ